MLKRGINCKFRENGAKGYATAGRFPTFGKILVKYSVLGSYNVIVVPMGVIFGQMEWTEGQISAPSVQRVATPGRKTSKSPAE